MVYNYIDNYILIKDDSLYYFGFQHFKIPLTLSTLNLCDATNFP